ncbi:MAG: hypothetical protein ACJ788_12095, partial [Ktedonobacteraceae bacterium]
GFVATAVAASNASRTFASNSSRVKGFERTVQWYLRRRFSFNLRKTISAEHIITGISLVAPALS